MKTNKVFYAVTAHAFTGSLIVPKLHKIINSERKSFRIPLGETVADAIMLTYPELRFTNFNQLRFQVFTITDAKRHRIIRPHALQNHYDFPHAIELNEFGCFHSLRMLSLGIATIRKNDKHNEEVHVALPDKTVFAGVRYVTEPTF